MAASVVVTPPLQKIGSDAPEGLRFPTRLAVKAMGVDRQDFEALVRSLVVPLIEPDTAIRITTRPSRGGKYISVSVHFTAQSRDQLEAIYRALHAEPRVLFTL